MSAVLKPREESEVSPSVPHFKSFGEITDERVRRAKEYEQVLLFALDKCPGLAPKLAPALEWAREEQRRSKPSDRQRVFRALAGGVPLTRAEVEEEVALPSSTVYKLLRELTDLGLVRRSKRPVFGNNMYLYVYSQAHQLPQIP